MASRRQPRLKTRSPLTAEEQRLEENARREQHWKRWGPYLSERAWGTVREDYSASGTAWEAFPHEHAPTVGMKTGSPASVTVTSTSALPSHSGTVMIRS